MLQSAKTYLSDTGFWLSVVTVSVVVSFVLVVIKAPGHRQ